MSTTKVINRKTLDMKLIAQRDFPRSSQKTYQIKRVAKGQQIDVPEIKALIKKLQTEGAKKNIKIMVRGLNADKWGTLKGFDTDLQIEEFDDYYKNKGIAKKDMEKFEKFSQLQITILMTNK